MTDNEKIMLDLLKRISELWLAEGVGSKRIEAYRNIIIETMDTVDYIEQQNTEFEELRKAVQELPLEQRIAFDWLTKGQL